ncbi:MAG: alpha/beta fold hydrolase [Bacteriovoracaceae bacterium]
MEQKKINVLNRNIAYLDSMSGELGTILFIHGNSFSSKTFSKQFESSIFEGYRLLALDLYGHGDSENLLNPFGYHLPQYAKLVVEFIKELGLSNIIIAGHSLGGHIALELLTHNIEGLVSGVFIWGTPPLSNPIKEVSAFLPNPAGAYLYQSNLSEKESIEFVSQCFGQWTEELSEMVKIVRKTSADARPSLGASVGQLNFADEVKAIEKAPFKVAVVYGTEDRLIDAAHFKSIDIKNLWNGQAHPLNGSHFCHIDKVDEFNLLFLDYVQDYTAHMVSPKYNEAAATLSLLQ